MPHIREVRSLSPALLVLLAAIWPAVRDMDVRRDLDLAEFHCGKKAITNAVARVGWQSVGLDILHGPHEDFCW